jgi:hypothetical protein
MNSVYGMPTKLDGDDGDSMLWAGLMVATGDLSPVKGIKLCQSEDGRLWRSPLRVNNQLINSFSRDMAMGFLLYFQETKDHEMANKWINYIKKTGYLFPPEESKDTRHIVTPSLWWLMSYAGMKVPLKWLLTRWLYRIWKNIEVKYTPRGYPSHLKAVSALLMAKRFKKFDKKVASFLVKRDPDNAFFRLMNGEIKMAQDLNTVFKNAHSHSLGKGNQWCWEREDTEEAWRDSMGWDFLFIEKLIIKIKQMGIK